MPDDELVVEIEKTDDANLAAAVDAAKPAGEAKTETKTEIDPIADLKAQHETLQAERDRERRRADAAQLETQTERNARIAAEQERDTVRTEAADTQLSAVDQALAAAKTAADAAEAEYATAMEAGDWKRASAAQRKLSEASADAANLKRDKADLELRKAQPERQRSEARQPQAHAADPVEHFIAVAGMDRNGQPVARTAAAQNWMRDHRDVISGAIGDQRKMMKLSAADTDAVAEGHTRDSPEYFAHVEKFLGIAKPGTTNGAGKQNGAQQQRRAQGAPVAPVQNTGGGMQGGGATVRLTAGEAKSATDGSLVWNYDDPSGQKRFKKGDPIGVQEFARRKLEMQKNGQYDKTYYEA